LVAIKERCTTPNGTKNKGSKPSGKKMQLQVRYNHLWKLKLCNHGNDICNFELQIWSRCVGLNLA